MNFFPGSFWREIIIVKTSIILLMDKLCNFRPFSQALLLKAEKNPETYSFLLLLAYLLYKKLPEFFTKPLKKISFINIEPFPQISLRWCYLLKHLFYFVPGESWKGRRKIDIV